MKTKITQARRLIREKYWYPLRNQIREYLKQAGKGAACQMARFLQCEPSQIHRFTCPICEHDAEPCYSTAVAIQEYLTLWKAKALPPLPPLNRKAVKPTAPTKHLTQWSEIEKRMSKEWRQRMQSTRN